MLLTDDLEAANKVRKWSTQAGRTLHGISMRSLGYNYRMSNVIAGVVRGQLPISGGAYRSKKSNL